MRCLACGEEMRVVGVVPDDTMLVHGYEHRTLECPSCHEVERRLQFAGEVEPVRPPLDSEPDQDQPQAAPNTVTAPANAVAPSSVTSSTLTSSTLTSSTLTSSTLTSSTLTSSTLTSSTWARAVDRLRSQQSYLQERQAQAKAAEATGRFREDWENLVPSRRQPVAIVAPPVPALPPVAKISKIAKPFSVAKLSNVAKPTNVTKPTNVAKPTNVTKPTNVSKPTDVAKSFRGSTIPKLSVKAAVKDARAPLRTAPSSAMARAIARLHTPAAPKPIDRSSDDSKRFDELWESFAPRPQPPAPAPSSPLASQSRSLVPAKELEASGAWARAMLMLRARR